MGELLARVVTRARLVAGLAAVALFAAMAWDTTFLGADDDAALQAPSFSPSAFVEEQFPATVDVIAETATPLTDLAPAFADDPDGTGAEHGVDQGMGRYVFAVRVDGVVTEVDDRFIVIENDELADADIRIPLTTALNGAPIRDVTGQMSFGDFANQTEYQSVANEFKRIVQEEVLGSIELDGLVGRTIDVMGAWLTGGPPDTYIIQPVAVEVAG